MKPGSLVRFKKTGRTVIFMGRVYGMGWRFFDVQQGVMETWEAGTPDVEVIQ
jgi:hypothetical protein